MKSILSTKGSVTLTTWTTWCTKSSSHGFRFRPCCRTEPCDVCDISKIDSTLRITDSIPAEDGSIER